MKLSFRSLKTASDPAMLASVGFGLLLGWKHMNISATLFADRVVSVMLALREGGLDYLPIYALIPMFVGLAASRDDRILKAPAALVLSCGTAFCLSALYFAKGLSGNLVMAAGALISVFSAALLTLWVLRLCSLSTDKPLYYVSLAFLTCFASSFLISQASAFAMLLGHILLPVASGVLYACSLVGDQGRNGLRVQVGQPAADANAFSGFPFRLFFGIAIVSMCVDMTNLFSEAKTSAPDELCLLVVGLLSALMLFGFSATWKSPSVSQSFKFVLVLIVASLFFVLIFSFDQPIYETATIALSGCVFRMFAYAMIYETSRRATMNRSVLLGLGVSVLVFVQYVDVWAYRILGHLECESVVVIALMVLLVILATVFLLDEKYLLSLIAEPGPSALDLGDEAALRACAAVAARRYGLTPREEEIAFYILKRRDNSEIAAEMFVAQNTLKVHTRNLYRKLGVHSRAEAFELLKSLSSQGLAV